MKNYDWQLVKSTFADSQKLKFEGNQIKGSLNSSFQRLYSDQHFNSGI